MIKKLVVLCFLCSWGLCFAQGPQAASFYVYDYKAVTPLAPAPAGYSPFYISHFGRHGARYCTSEYETLHDIFAKASDKGLLTDGGKAFFERYENFYQKVNSCKGNLTGIGKDQHRLIAAHMFQRFPALFEGPTHVEAVATESPRVIMSMWSFLSSLQGLDSDIDIAADASSKYASWLQPSLKTNPYLVKNAMRHCKAAEDAVKEYFEKTVPWKEIVLKFFTGAEVLEEALGTTPEKFIEALHAVVVCTYCLDFDNGCFDDLLSASEMEAIWKGISARYFLDTANYTGSGSLRLDYSAFTLGQIIESAEADIASGDTQLRLRFGHDSGIAPLFAVLDVNGWGRASSSFDEAIEIFPSYEIPMGASLQLVFFRNAEGDILLQVLANERAASLPIDAVHGAFYRWNDFKAHYLPIVASSKEKINNMISPF